MHVSLFSSFFFFRFLPEETERKAPFKINDFHRKRKRKKSRTMSSPNAVENWKVKRKKCPDIEWKLYLHKRLVLTVFFSPCCLARENFNLIPTKTFLDVKNFSSSKRPTTTKAAIKKKKVLICSDNRHEWLAFFKRIFFRFKKSSQAFKKGTNWII